MTPTRHVQSIATCFPKIRSCFFLYVPGGRVRWTDDTRLEAVNG